MDDFVRRDGEEGEADKFEPVFEGGLKTVGHRDPALD